MDRRGAALIPRIFHQIWLGPRPLPEEFAPYVESWRAHHPQWEHHLWTEDTLPPGLRREVYERLRSPAERSDVLRLELLARLGGVYVDTDFECLRPIDELLEEVDLFAAEVKDGRINNALIGAAAGHPAILRALEEVRPLERHGTVDKFGTGPFFVDRIFKEGGATIFDWQLFYPSALEREGAYAVHHMARSWKDADGYRRSIRLAKRRLATAQAELVPLRALGRARIRAHYARRRLDRGFAKAARAARPQLDTTLARMGRRRATATRVPRVIHTVWTTPGELPRDVAARLESWRLCHPDWTHRLWREDDLPDDLMAPEAADPLRAPAEREELLRLELVLRHGGVAVDLQLACRRRIDGAIAGLEAFAASSAPGLPDAALVGGVADHPAFRRALELAKPYEWHPYTGETGRAALVHALDEQLVLLPPELLGRGLGAPWNRALAVRAWPEDSPEARRRLLEQVLAAEERLRKTRSVVARRGGTV